MSSVSGDRDAELVAAVTLATDGAQSATREHVHAILKKQGIHLDLPQVGVLLEDLARRGQIQRLDAVPGDGLPTFGFRPVLWPEEQ